MKFRFKYKGNSWDVGIEIISEKIIKKCWRCRDKNAKVILFYFCDTEPIEPNHIGNKTYLCELCCFRKLKFSQEYHQLLISDEELEEIKNAIEK